MTQPDSNHDSAMSDIVAENAHAIGQLVSLLDNLPVGLYRQSFGSRKQHVIGKHVRHIIDHYESLLLATRSHARLLDYENRNREPLLETHLQSARHRLSLVLQELRRRFGAGHSGRLSMIHNSDGEQQLVPTSVARELVFLASHTVHHMAIVGMLAEQAGVEVGEEFGVHPSTLRYLHKQTTGLVRSA